MNIGLQEIAIGAALLLALGFAFWVRSVIRNRNNGQNNASSQKQ